MASSISTIKQQHVLITGPPGVGKTTLVRKVCAALVEKCGLKVQGFYTEEVRGHHGQAGGRGPRIGFDVVSMDGSRAPLARVQSDAGRRSEGACHAGPSRSRHMVGKYSVDIESFEGVALPALSWMDGAERSGRRNLDLVSGRNEADGEAEIRVGEETPQSAEKHQGSRHVLVIDEIGKMELFSPKFVGSVSNLFDGRYPSPSGAAAPGGGVVLLVTIPVVRSPGKEHKLLQSIRQREDCALFQVTEMNRDTLLQELLTFICQRTQLK